ncbi:MAG: hypothetical protein LC798_17055 [Chloroflexi bacterium]|nr:hypothetical protein [Chloroflexota bacterium]
MRTPLLRRQARRARGAGIDTARLGAIRRCANPAGWHPTLHTINRHHHPPLSWREKLTEGGDDGAWWRVVDLCGICHDETHTLLNLYVKAGGVPAWSVRRTYSPFVRDLVSEAWAKRPTGRLPYTIAARAA